MLDEYSHQPRVACFSMEIASRSEIPTYAGGLGVPAGDTIHSAADLAPPLAAVRLVSLAGYFRQESVPMAARSSTPQCGSRSTGASRSVRRSR